MPAGLAKSSDSAMGPARSPRFSVVPSDLVLDRLYVHGDVVKGQFRAMALNSRSTTISNSHFSDMKMSGGDSQAIAAWNGPGPFVITNNFIEAAGQNVLVGAIPPADSSLTPSQITIKRNTFSKQLAWRGQPWGVKSLLEVKNAAGVVVDGNVFQNVWAANGAGFAALFYTANTPWVPAWSAVRDVQFTNNTVRNVSSGLYIAQDPTGTAAVSNIVVRNNLFDSVSAPVYGGVGAFLALLGGSDIVVDHNTAVTDGQYRRDGIDVAHPASGLHQQCPRQPA